MSELINIENYESYYLDFLEGNLNENDTALLLAFLEENPLLKVEDSEFSVFSPDDSIQFDGFSKSLLKFQAFDQLIDADNIEFFLIASIEKQLSDAKTKELQQFLVKNPAFLIELQQYEKAHLIADKSIIYPDKQKLKRGIFIPMYARFLTAAAGIALFFGILNLNQIDTPKVIAQGKNTIKAKVKTEVEKEMPNEMIAANSADVIQNLTFRRVEHGKEKLIEQSQFENIEPLGFKSPQKLNNQPLLNDIAVAYIKPFSAENRSDDFSESSFAALEMKNPIQPITSRIGEAINQQVDFKTTKAAHKKPGGFLFRIGKFEISRKVYDNSSVAAK
jgi:hypothetical protein